MRQIVFIGNCQVQALSHLYERFAGRADRETVAFLPSYEDLSEDSRRAIETADVVVEQRMDLPPRADVGGVTAPGERHFVPLLAGGFLWPYAGQPRPDNDSPWHMRAGPWNAELSDGYLNRLILQGMAPEQAVAQYLALDVHQARNLDRMLELILDRQRSRDEVCGYDIASVVEAHFRDELVFRTPHHPNLRVAMAFATQFFDRMGVPRAAAARMTEQTRVTPFPKDVLPIHPSVARHFGLSYAREGTRYKYLNEGSYTFPEYALRYMRNEWNADLADGLANAHPNPELALPQLDAGLAMSPGAAEGHFVRADVLRRLGRPEEAEPAIRRAVAAEPDEARYQNGLAHALAELGRLDEAAVAIRRAASLDPYDPHYHGMRAILALRMGQNALAEASANRVLELDPRNAHAQHLIGDLRRREGDLGEAIVRFRRAADLDPSSAGFNLSLSAALADADRLPDAIEAARAAAAADPSHGATRVHLEHLLSRAGQSVDVVERLRADLRARPDEAGLHHALGEALSRLDRMEGAADAFARAAALQPAHEGFHAALSHALARMGRTEDAAASIEAAIGARGDFAPFHIHHGNLLRLAGRLDESEAAYKRALALSPDSREAREQLHGVRLARDAELGLAAE